MFTANICRHEVSGETSFSGAVFFCGRRVFLSADRPTQNQVQIEVLEWAQRTGKTSQLDWHYPNPNTNMKVLHRFVSSATAAQEAADDIISQLPASSAASEISLSRQESAELFDCEKTIQEGLDTFVEVGRALARIRDSRLYRHRYGNFEQYVRERWSMSARHAHRLVDGAQIAQNLLPDAAEASEPEPAQAPRNESQVRPLKGLEPEEQRQTWKEAVKLSANGLPTAKDVRKAREQLRPKPSVWDRDQSREIIVDVSRVAPGGDIDRANCCDLLAAGWRSGEPPTIQTETVFEYERDLWVVSIGHHGGGPRHRICSHEAHRLIPDNSQYDGPQESDSPEGRIVLWKGCRMRLGPKVIFSGEGRVSIDTKTLELDLEVQAVKPLAPMERIRLAADALVKSAAELRQLLEDDQSDSLSIKQRLHLGIAITHLKNFRGSLDQEADPGRKAQEYSRKGNAKARKEAARKAIQAAAAKRWKKAKTGPRFVICRKSQSGAVTFKTAGGGWTNHPNKAKTFLDKPAAQSNCHHSYDKPMMLHRAQGLRA